MVPFYSHPVDMTSPTADSAYQPWWRANAFVAMFLSALVPGLGQLYSGRRRRGAVLIGITGALLLVAAASLRDETRWLTWSVQPTALKWLLVGNGALLAFRAYAAADAFFTTRHHDWGPLADRAIAVFGSLLVAATLALVAVPHAWAGYLDVVQYDLITTVFTASAPEPVEPPAPTTPPPPSSTTTTEPLAPGQTAPPTTPPPPSTTTTTTIPPRLWDGTERLNVLLLGGDGGKGRTSIRTDTIILASIDPQTGHTALFSVPRNMAQVPLPDEIWDCQCFPGIINALWRWADDRPGRFPGYDDPGADVLKLAIGELTGLDVHYYAMINLVGFIDLVDAIGGIDITVPTRVRDEYTGPDGVNQIIDLQPGEYHFDGYQTLGYVRVRKATSDYNRMGRQRCVLRAIVKQADPLTVIRAFPAIATVLKNNLFTDIPLEQLPDFIELVPVIAGEDIVSVRFVPDRFTGPRTPDRYPTPDLDEIRTVVREVISSPVDEAVESLNLENLSEACG